MFPFSINSSITISAPATKLELMLDMFGDALRRAGVTRIDRSPCRLEFKNPRMLMLSYKLFVMISSGAIWLEVGQGKIVINYQMKTMKILGALLPVAVLSYGIIQAENLAMSSKVALITGFLALFSGGNYVISSIRIHRWVMSIVRACATAKE